MSVMMFPLQSMDILLIASFLLELSLLSFVVKRHKQHKQALTRTMILIVNHETRENDVNEVCRILTVKVVMRY